ncbi:MAG: GAF domain-containing protein [Bacteroidales bacterium]
MRINFKNLKIKYKLAIVFGLITSLILLLGLTAWVGFGVAKRSSQASSALSGIENSVFFARLEVNNYINNPTDSIFHIAEKHIDEAFFRIYDFQKENSNEQALSEELIDAVSLFKDHFLKYHEYNFAKDDALNNMKTASEKAVSIAFAKAAEGIELDNRGFINFLSAKISEKEFIIEPTNKNLDNWRLFINNAIKINRDGNMQEVANGLEEYSGQFEIFANTTFLQEDIINKLEKVADETVSLTNLAQKEKQLQLDERLQRSNIVLLTLLIICILLSFLIYRITIGFVNPLKSTTQVLMKLSQGNLNKIRKIDVNSDDEIGKMSKALNVLIERFDETANFAIEIGKDNLNAKLNTRGEDDVLGNALVQMRESLVNAEQDNKKRKKEEDNRNWISQGLANFADILRLDNDDMYEMSYNIISNLVKYLNANQGGIFLLNEEDKNDVFLEQTACYAYSRRKFNEKKIKLGETLVGACFLEKKPKYLKNIPDSYLEITSGLGEASPGYLYITPLVVNDIIIGVIEIASFYNFDKHHLEFIDNVSEDIAGAISSVKTNLQTAYLLKKSEEQAEEMRRKEEEMRQTIEDLSLKQEEMKRDNQQ